MNRNLPNTIYKNIFTQQDIKDIYEVVEKTKEDQTFVIKQYRQKAYFTNLPQHVINKITNFVQNIYSEKIKLTEISFATYRKTEARDPILSPHFDTTFNEPRLTFDIQLNSNIDWPIVVEGQSFTLKNNQALTFSGTHQVHWREYREFKDEDFIDMIFCHFSLEENNNPITLEETKEIHKRFMYYMDTFYQDVIERIKSERKV